MKRMLWRRALALLLVLLLALPAAAFALESRGENALGTAEEGDALTYPAPRRLLRSAQAPSRYDPRESGFVTRVKDQDVNPICWAFGSLGAMELNLLKNGYGEQDLSEQHMYYATAPDGGNGTYGFVRGSKQGHRLYAASYLMRGAMSGAVLEEADPYDTFLRTRDASVTAAITPSYRAQNMIMLSGDTSTIAQLDLKNAVLEYGAVGASMYWKGVATSEAGTASTANYNAQTAAYYSAEKNTTNHMVLIVGWDDAFSAENFMESNRPETDGAWLVKNSWGSGWGDGGYFWVSYADATFPAGTFVVDGAEIYSEREVIYETEYLTTTASLAGPSQYAKVFTAQSSGEQLTAVRLYLTDAETDLTISVFTSGDFVASDPAAEQPFYAKNPGWYTVKLDTPVTLGDAGSAFSIRVSLVSGKKHVGYDKLTPIAAGENYYYSGSAWKDLSQAGNYNMAIKAVAQKAPPRGDANGDGLVNGKDVTILRQYFAGGYDARINESASDVSRDGYVNGKDVTILRRYFAGGYGVTLD